ncbi:Ionotropic receptor 154 [Blattella germanica]|nr:Ionotropic receptor 154 [Blattella germanica]
MLFTEELFSIKNIFVVLALVQPLQVSTLTIEDKCRIARIVAQRYQSRCVFLLKPNDGPDMETELLSFKYLNQLSRMFMISSMIQDKWKNYLSRETCQPFLFAVHNISNIDAILEPFTESTYRANTKWLLFEDSIKKEENAFFNNTYVPLDAEFLLAQQSPANKEITVISEVFHILPNTTLRKQAVGLWHPQKGLTWTNKSCSERRNDFQGNELKAAFMPFGKIIFIEEKGGKAMKFGGFLYQIWETLQNGLNFTTKIQRIAEGRFGVQDANGSWSGMTGMLQRKQIDIGLMTLMLSTSRLSVLDYFVPVIKSSLSIFIKRARSEDNSLDQLLKPLSDALWVAVGCIVLLASALLTVAWLYADRGIHRRGTETEYNLTNSLFYVFGIFCQSAHGLATNSWSTRLVIINSNALGFVVYGAYSAMLFSFLAIRKYQIPFNDIKDLMDDGRYKLGLLTNSAHFLVFTETKDPIIMEAYKKLVLAEKSHPTSIEEGLRRVCERKHYAYMMLKFFEKELRPGLHLSCNYVALPKFSAPTTLGIGCNKNSPLKRVINYHIIKLHEGGLVKLFDERLIPLRFRAPPEEDVTIAASLEKVTTIFIVFLAGIVASIVILLVEICVYRFKNVSAKIKGNK